VVNVMTFPVDEERRPGRVEINLERCSDLDFEDDLLGSFGCLGSIFAASNDDAFLPFPDNLVGVVRDSTIGEDSDPVGEGSHDFLLAEFTGADRWILVTDFVFLS
jgi:hypothetical protein